MITETLKELKTAKSRLAERERTAEKQRADALLRLPRDFGFESIEEFIAAVREAHGKPMGPGKKSTKSNSPTKKGERAKITPEMKEHVMQAVNDGKTGAEIAKALKISLPSVHNIKGSSGLLKLVNSPD